MEGVLVFVGAQVLDAGMAHETSSCRRCVP